VSEDLKIGFIGCGNMATAIIHGIIQSELLPAFRVAVSDTLQEKPKELRKKLGVQHLQDNITLCRYADIVFLAIKPNTVQSVLDEAREYLSGKAVVSIAAGWRTDRLRSHLPDSARVLRVMPNTPLMVGEGMSAFSSAGDLSETEMSFADKVFSSLGRVETVSEDLMDAVTGVSGSGPAYFYMFIDSLAKAGVAAGLQPDAAITMAAQTALGAAKMVLETHTDPKDLRLAVCSPGGTTIEAVKSFEEDNLDEIVSRAVGKCIEKSKVLSRS
jgi:pyrroline-5-carboxylate reductase